jgi:hypothetical protein
MNLDEIRKANELKKAKANAKKGKTENPPMLPTRPRPWLAEGDAAPKKGASSSDNILNNQKDTTLKPAIVEPAHNEPALNELPLNKLAEVRPAHAKPALVEPAGLKAASHEPAHNEPALNKPPGNELADIEAARDEPTQVEPAALEPAIPATLEQNLNTKALEGRDGSDQTVKELVVARRSGDSKVEEPAAEEDWKNAPSPGQEPSHGAGSSLAANSPREIVLDAEASVEISNIQDVLLGRLGIRAFPVIRLYCALYDMAKQSKNSTVCLIRPDLMKIVGTNSNATVSRVIEKGKTFQFWKVSTIFFQKGDLKPGTYFEINLNAINLQ